MNLIFSPWKIPRRVQFNVTATDEDDSRTATSTLHINNVTRNHDGMYQCNVRNGRHQNNRNSVSYTIVVEGNLLHS